MNDLHAQDLHDLFPLRISFVGLQDVLAPEAVSPLDEAEDAQGVDIIAQGDTVGLHESLSGLDVAPGGLVREEVGEEQLATEVIDGGDQGPFLLRRRRPQVVRGIVLHQGANGGGQHFAVVGFGSAVRDVTAERLGPTGDGGSGDGDALLLQPIAQGRVVVVRDGEVRVFDQLLLPEQLPGDLGFNSRRQLGWRCPLIGEGEGLGIVAVLPQ